LKSEGWRTEKIADDPNVYEWWYFDSHNHDRTVITGPTLAIETFPIDRFTSATNSCDVRSGGLTMRGDFTELQIRGKVKDHEIDVVFRPTATPLRPGNGYVFLGSTDTFQGWFNAIAIQDPRPRSPER
jgi:hypothetical protein